MLHVSHGQRFGLLTVMLVIGSIDPASAVEEPAAETAAAVEATVVTKTWIVALMSGEIDEVMAASELPFSWDRKMLVKTEEDLRALYAKVVADKGSRDLKPSKITYADKARTARLLDSATFDERPDVLAVVAWFGDEGIGILVTKGPSPKVRGFSD